MTTRRRFVLALGATALAAPFAAVAQQQATKVHRIGWLGGSAETNPAARKAQDAFRAGMRDLGYIEGKNLVIEVRLAEGRYERYPVLAAELVQLKLDVIVSAGGTTATRALRQATPSIPIVIGSGSDPVAMGFAASLARPGGNITGVISLTGDLNPKRLELLVAAVPGLAHVAVLINPDNATHPSNVKSVESAARSLGIKVLRPEARNAEELDRAFALSAREGARAVIVVEDSFFNLQPRHIAALALKHRLPSITPELRHVEAGSLMSFGDDALARYRRVASYVDKILKGAKPGELPIEQPTKFELVVNMKTAKALGITIPQSILVRADRVIE